MVGGGVETGDTGSLTGWEKPCWGSTRTRHGRATAPRGSRKPKGEQKGWFIDVSAVPTRNSNHFWTQASGSPAGSGMLPAFPISPWSSPSLPAGDPRRAQLRQLQPGAGGDFVSAAACLEPQGLDSGTFGTNPLLARVSWLSVPLGITPAPAKREKGNKGWGQNLAHPYNSPSFSQTKITLSPISSSIFYSFCLFLKPRKDQAGKEAHMASGDMQRKGNMGRKT